MINNRVALTPYIFLFKSLLFILCGFILTRFIFFIFNVNYFPDFNLDELLSVFLHGLRFDLSSIAFLNTPILLYLLSVGWAKSLTAFSNMVVFIYVLLVNTLALFTNLIDTVYFAYTGRRSGPEIISMFGDVSTQIPQLFVQYWPFVLLSFALIIVTTIIFLRLKRNIQHINIPLWKYSIFCLVIVFSFTLAARGGFQSKPIRALHAYSWPSSELGAIVLNTPFMLLRQKTSEVKELNYFSSDNDAYEVLKESPIARNDVVKVISKKQNVVVIILESFSLEYFGPPYGKKNYVPFLTQLTEKGRFFPNGIANGRRSIEAIPSVLSGMPSLMDEAFSRSIFQSNKVYGLGEIVKPYGYSTAFFHGAKNGSMYFDETTYRFGFDKYFGRDEYPDDKDFDGQWGIFDEPFLQFTADKLNQLKRPFLSGIFTISSHPPYSLPTKYKNIITEGDIPMHKVVQYTDLSLKAFFEKASKMDWYKNTLFIITADHTSENFDNDFATPFGRHQIPIILYHPAEKVKPDLVTEVAQQIDIPATVIDFLALPETNKLLPFGRSLLRNSEQASALIKENGSFWLLSQGKYVKLTIGKEQEYQYGTLPDTFTNKPDETAPEFEATLLQRNKAYLQLYFNGLINNQHYFESK